jgi:hypothetical protein
MTWALGDENLFSLVLGIFSTLFIPIYALGIRPPLKEKCRILRTSEIEAISMSDILRENNMEEYCEIFERNRIENVGIAISLSEADLENMGITVLGDRIKLIYILDEQRDILETGQTE